MATAPTSVPIRTNLQEFVAARVDSGDFDSPEDYVSYLILNDEKRLHEALEQRLLQSLQGGFIEIPEGVLESGDLHLFLEQELRKRNLR